MRQHKREVPFLTQIFDVGSIKASKGPVGGDNTGREVSVIFHIVDGLNTGRESLEEKSQVRLSLQFVSPVASMGQGSLEIYVF